MKKILFFILTCIISANSVQRVWNSSSSANMNLSTNYTGSGALLTTDTLVYNATSVVGATATADLAVACVIIKSVYTGAWRLSAYTLTCGTGDFIDSGTVAMHNFNYGLIMKGNGAKILLSSGLATGANSTNFRIQMLGTNQSIVNDKGLDFESLLIGENCQTTLSGSASFYAVKSTSTSNTPLLMFGGSTLTINQECNFTSLVSNDTIHKVASTATITGSAITSFKSSNTTGTTILIGVPQYTRVGTGSFYISPRGQGDVVFNQRGHITVPAMMIFGMPNTYGNMIYNTLGNDITSASYLAHGAQADDRSATINYSNSIVNVASTAFTSTYGATINLDTSTFTIHGGSCKFGPANIVNGGRSTINFKPSGIDSFLTYSQQFYNINVDSVGGTLIQKGVLHCNKLSILNGSFSPLATTDTIFADSIYVGTTSAVTFPTISGTSMKYFASVTGANITFLDNTTTYETGASPTITTISPTSGRILVNFTLTGANFLSTDRWFFNSVYLTTTNTSSTTISGTIPSWLPRGYYNIIVKPQTGTPDTLTRGFRVLTPYVKPREVK